LKSQHIVVSLSSALSLIERTDHLIGGFKFDFTITIFLINFIHQGQYFFIDIKPGHKDKEDG